MLRHKPTFDYRGLTIIMSNPSRFDHNKLLDGISGLWFNEECLYPHLNRYTCDIRLIDDKSPLLPNTKVVLLFGQKALTEFTGVDTGLDVNVGSPIIVNGIPCIPAFNVQDCFDMKDYEAKFNAEAIAGEGYDEEEENVLSVKGRSKTSRANYKFWTKVATKKAIQILENNGKIPDRGYAEPEYIINPTSQVLIDILTNTKGQEFHLDIETDPVTADVRCIGFMFDNDPSKVYVFQLLDLEYKWAYGRLPEILRAFAIALRDNEAVAHNGATFDFFVFAWKLGIGIGKNSYDTMAAQLRIYPDIEKSLGHCIALHTFEPYHKDEGNHTYRSEAQAQQLMYYCGKDVFGMFLVKKAQDKLAAKDPGLAASIRQVNRAIRPYLITTLTGIRFNEEARQAWVKENDRKMIQYLRIMSLLTGSDVPPLISNQKCVHYFHTLMGYPVVMRTNTGGASLGKDALFKLALKYGDNPVIQFLLKYREVQKETGTLNFKVWLPNTPQIQNAHPSNQELNLQ